MRTIIINIIILCMFGFLFYSQSSKTTTSASNTQTVSASNVKTASDIAKMWDFAVNNRDSESVYSIFKAIELKKDKSYEPALREYIKLRKEVGSRSYTAQSIYTLAKIDASGAETEFNELLSHNAITPNVNPSNLALSKRQAMEYMLKLGIKPNKTSVEQVKKDISTIIGMKYPAIALDLIGPLKRLGYEISQEERMKVAEHVSDHWRNINADDFKTIGIQPDWNKMFVSKDASVQGEKLVKLFLTSADDKARKNYSKTISKIENKDKTVLGRAELLVNATVGDKNAIHSLKTKITPDQRYYTSLSPESLPNEILIKAIEVAGENLRIVPESKLIAEAQKRGLKSTIDKYFERMEIIASVEATWESFIPMEKIRAADAISFYDPYKALDLLTKMLEKSPRDNLVPYHMVNIIRMSPYYETNAIRLEEWIRKNPEKLAKAIKVLLETSNEPLLKEQMESREFPWSESDQYFHKNLAFSMMPYLSNDVFNLYFKKLDSKYFTQGAYLAGMYFNAEWVVPSDQKEFYRKYSYKKV